MPVHSLSDRIDALLPQTQCGRCGYSACRPYAQAIARGEVALNRCPPGGTATIAALAELLGQTPLALDPACGTAGPVRRAVVDEQWCIGCTLCLQVCPVDAIVGAAKQMHTVIAEECTGCELCIEPCPVDCIRLVDAGDFPLPVNGDGSRAERARRRYQQHRRRLERTKRDAPARPACSAETAPGGNLPSGAQAGRKAVIAAAVARARARRRARGHLVHRPGGEGR